MFVFNLFLKKFNFSSPTSLFFRLLVVFSPLRKPALTPEHSTNDKHFALAIFPPEQPYPLTVRLLTPALAFAGFALLIQN